MEAEYNKLIFNIGIKPSPKSIMVSIPMYMYRIETNEFTYGLNFFQKTVLKFKSKPGIKSEKIAQLLGLDPKLIESVASELMVKGLLNEYGSLSDKGKEKLNEVDGLVINSGKRKLGYVFKYVNQDKLYQYLVSQITYADVIEEGKNSFPKIVTGTKGNGVDYCDTPRFLDDLFRTQINVPKPAEKEILTLIQNADKKRISTGANETSEQISGLLGIRFINEQPLMVWVCTYIYLHQTEDNFFEPDWRVLDPFGFGDNVALKFYLNSPVNKLLLARIDEKFGDVKIIGGKILSDYQEQLNKHIEDILLSDFSLGIKHLDANLQQYINLIVKNYILQKDNTFNDLDANVSFSLNLQNVLENILKQDKEKRSGIYDMVYSEFDADPLKKRKGLIDIYRQRLFGNDTMVPNPLLNSSKGILSRGNSLLSYLVSFILTYTYDNKSSLFKVLKGKIDLIIEVAQLRNEKGHGQTSREKALKPLSEQESVKYYSFMKELINDYIKNQ